MLKHWNWHPLTLSSFSCSCYTAKRSYCCSAFSCNRDRSSGKNYHFYIFHCDTLVICLIAVALLGKHKYYQEIKPDVLLKKSFRASFLGQLSNAWTGVACSSEDNSISWEVGLNGQTRRMNFNKWTVRVTAFYSVSIWRHSAETNSSQCLLYFTRQVTLSRVPSA